MRHKVRRYSHDEHENKRRTGNGSSFPHCGRGHSMIPATVTVTFPALAGAIAIVFLAGILLGILAGTVNNRKK